MKKLPLVVMMLAGAMLSGWFPVMAADEAPEYIMVVDSLSGFSGDPVTGPHTASMKWKTTTPSRIIVRYGKTIYREISVRDDVLKSQHALYLEKLDPLTTYVLTIETEGANGATGSPQIFFFTTKGVGVEEAPRFLSGKEEQATEEKKTGSLGITIDWGALDAKIESAYFVPMREYRYQWLAVSSPSFLDMQISQRPGNEAVLSLSSTIPEGELPFDVRYGIDGNSLLFSRTALDGPRATLRGIDPARPYAFQVESRRRDGSRHLITAKSRVIHSSELGAPLRNIDPPKFSAVKTVNAPTSYRLAFTASTAVRAEWEYKVIGTSGSNQIVRKSTLQESHDMVLENLTSKERYRSELRITDQWGNEMGYIIEFKTRASDEKPETVIDLTHPVGQQYSFYKGQGEILFYGIGEYIFCALSPEPDSSHGSSHSQIENRKPPYDYNHRFTFTPTRETYSVTCSKRDGSSITQTFSYPEVKPVLKKEESPQVQHQVQKQELIRKEEPMMCATVMTLGKNTKTGEYRQFSSSCIPDGWVYVTSSVDEMERLLKQQRLTDEKKRAQQKEDVEEKAKLLTDQKFDTILAELNEPRSKVKEQNAELTYLKKFAGDAGNLTTVVKESLTNFVTYGVDTNTKDLGAGERAAVLYSYKAAYGRIPQNDQDFSDMILIANGRFPKERSKEAEERALRFFKTVYKRVPNLKNNQNDVAAVMVMTYGLRQGAENRNLTSERGGITSFRAIFGKTPVTTEEWNVMQAITYSGAKRKADADKDLLSDEDEKVLGTDSGNPDTDKDGYIDGLEIENGYSPSGEGKLETANWLLPPIRSAPIS